MSNPILFFIFIMVINLILKSSQDKKKMQRSKEKKAREFDNTPPIPGPMEELKRMLDNELDRNRPEQRRPIQQARPIEKARTMKPTTYKSEFEKPKKESKIPSKPAPQKPVIEASGGKGIEINVKKDLLMGIVFSEILSKPKSMQNQRRGL